MTRYALLAFFFLFLVGSSAQAATPLLAGGACENLGALSTTSDEKDLVTCLKDKKGDLVWKSLVTPERPPVPAGLVAYFTLPYCPAGWIEANGQSTTGYQELSQKIGIVAPDLRGYFLRSWDNGRGIDASRGFATVQEDAIRNITASIQSTGNAGANGVNLFREKTGKGAFYATGKIAGRAPRSFRGGNGQPELHFDASRAVPTAKENRPKNIALIACIATGE